MSRIYVLSIPVILSIVVWYLHEQYPAEFMAVTLRIPYMKEFAVSIHSMLGSPKGKDQETRVLKMFTSEELSMYNGEAGSKGLYIGILGRVYDVAKGRKHYEPGAGYHTFAGRDNSNAFVTGEFAHYSNNVLDLTPAECLSIQDWTTFYDKEYIYKGKIVGPFYNENGGKTDYHKEFDEKVAEAINKKNTKKNEELQFPPCNVEWNKDTGSRVWCTTKSGGIERSWTGVPRKLYQVGAETFRCACINLMDIENPGSTQYSRRGHLKDYQDCHPTATSCHVYKET